MRRWLLARCCTTTTLAVLCAGGIGCRPQTSEDSIYRDTSRQPDPALTSPYLECGAPGQAEPITPRPVPSVQPGPVEPPTPPRPLWQSADPADPSPFIRVRVDGQTPGENVGGRTVRIARAVSLEPTIRFDVDKRMGEVRSVAIQFYKVVDGQANLSSGVRITEAGDRVTLVPGQDIFLPQPAEGVTLRRITTGRVLPSLTLSAGEEYEIQFLIGGNRQAATLAVRVHTTPPATSQPETAAPSTQPGPGEPDPSRLPPGVTIP